MTPKQSLDWVKGFESRCNDLNYNIAGVDCWPIIRITLLSMVLPKSSQRAGAGYNIAGASVMDVVSSIRDLLSFKRSNVFILTDSKFSAKFSDSIYLKDSHVISEGAKLNSKTSIIALQNLFVDKSIVGREHCRSVFAVLLLAAGAAKFSFVIKCIPGLSRYIERVFNDLAAAPMLREGAVSYKALRKQVYRNILFCLVAKMIFSMILRRVKPETAYVVCYYSVLGMALCAACRQLGISITDIQHGVGGGSMRAYAGWLKVPRQGYTTLPDTFFCWTRFDAEAITEWAQNTTQHTAIVVGSMWRDFVQTNSLLATAERQWADFLKEISVYEKKILITMQSSTLSQVFVDVIQQCQTNCCFLIKMHPGFLLEKNSIYRDLSGYYPNVFVEQPSSMPIQVIMKYVDVHLTGWSGSVVDAYFEGVKSVVISIEALDYFSDFIASGAVIYAVKADDVIDRISSTDTGVQ
ncbi:hypothetical protein [Pseudomonas peli]|uniref:hypothetical protein n=1 Tax=Pseudomonas peli TaxID=592361 RepID=UPI003D318BEC